MRSVIATLAVLIAVSPAAHCWNEQGHFLVARLAWLEMGPEWRSAVSEILRAHPHYEEYLTAERPVGVKVDEWAFLRAAYWPDWVRSNHSEEYSKPTWHYVTAAFTPPGRPRVEVDAKPPNVVTQITLCTEKLRDGTPVEKAIYLCWLVHLTGDIHQPLHCASLFNETFPEGDRGGNLSLVRIGGGMPVRLHATWDNLFGEATSLPLVDEEIARLQKVEQENMNAITFDLHEHQAPADWAAEGFANASRFAYLNGDLSPPSADANPAPELVPNLTPTYIEQAMGAVRISVLKAGRRLTVAISRAVD